MATVLLAIDFALQRELDSILYYQEMRAFVPERHFPTIDAIIAEERKHFAILSEARKRNSAGDRYTASGAGGANDSTAASLAGDSATLPASLTPPVTTVGTPSVPAVPDGLSANSPKLGSYSAFFGRSRCSGHRQCCPRRRSLRWLAVHVGRLGR